MLTISQSDTSDRHVEHSPGLRSGKGNDPPKCSQRFGHLITTQHTRRLAYSASRTGFYLSKVATLHRRRHLFSTLLFPVPESGRLRRDRRSTMQLECGRGVILEWDVGTPPSGFASSTTRTNERGKQRYCFDLVQHHGVSYCAERRRIQKAGLLAWRRALIRMRF